MRLIDADALTALEELEYYYNPVRDGKPWYKADDVWDCIDKQPTIVPKATPKGRWIECDWVEPDDHYSECIRTPKAAKQCSRCKHCFKKELLWKDNYCPNCGADMKGEK